MTDVDMTDVQVLHVEDGDVLVVRYDQTEVGVDSVRDHATKLRDMYERQGKKTTVLVMPFTVDLEQLDEDKMRLMGWVRPARNVEKLIEAKDVIRSLLDADFDIEPSVAERAEHFVESILE